MSKESTSASHRTAWTASSASDFSGSWTDDEGTSSPYPNVSISVGSSISLTFSNYGDLGNSPYTGSFSNGEITFNTDWRVTTAGTRTVGTEEKKCLNVVPPPAPVAIGAYDPQTERYTKDD